MAVLKMVFKIAIHCGNCKMAILKAVAKLEGIDQITMDAEKGTLTVIGEVDPVCVAGQLRKVRRPPLIDGVGPNEPAKKEEAKELPTCCKYCSGETVFFADSVSDCTIH